MAETKQTVKKAKKRSEITPDHLGLGEYIRRIGKQVHPDTKIAKGAVLYVEDMNKVLLKLMMRRINLLLDMSRAKTISSKDVQSAVALIFRGDLKKHAIAELAKAVTKFNSNINNKEIHSRAARAGLVFPVSRIENLMRELSTDERVGGTSSIAMAAVLEYITAELVELGGNAARDNKRKTIMIRDISQIVKADEELNMLFEQDTIQTCSVAKNIHPFLLQAKKVKKSKK